MPPGRGDPRADMLDSVATDSGEANDGAWTLREARVEDVAELFRVRTSVQENHQSEAELAEIGVTRTSVAAMIASPEAGAWCVETRAGIVGFSMARLEGREVFALFVQPAYQRRGIGSALLERAVAWLRSKSDEPVHLSTGRGTTADAFYRSRHWREVDVTEEGDPILQLG